MSQPTTTPAPAPQPAPTPMPTHDLYRQVEQTVHQAEQLSTMVTQHLGGAK